jgi:transposase InsO family protein
MLSAAEQERIGAARRRSGWGPGLIASEVGHPHATVRRHGLSRRPSPPREAVVGYEWRCPGDLLHVDTKRFQRFTRPGHAVTGDRHRTGLEKRLRVGHEFVHSVVDDHSRLAYSELHRDERAATVVGFVDRALAFFEAQGTRPKRLMSDNHWSYTHNRALRELLARRRVRHLLIEPYRPRTDGKVERYQQTLKREWALGRTYRSSTHRAEARQHSVHHYNEQRRHSAIGNQPPTSRVRNLPGQDN